MYGWYENERCVSLTTMNLAIASLSSGVVSIFCALFMAPMYFGARPVSYVVVLTAFVVASEVLEAVPVEHPARSVDPIVNPAAAVVIVIFARKKKKA